MATPSLTHATGESRGAAHAFTGLPCPSIALHSKVDPSPVRGGITATYKAVAALADAALARQDAREDRRLQARRIPEAEQSGDQGGDHSSSEPGPNRRKSLLRLARPAGLEPATVGLEILSVDFSTPIAYACV